MAVGICGQQSFPTPLKRRSTCGFNIADTQATEITRTSSPSHGGVRPFETKNCGKSMNIFSVSQGTMTSLETKIAVMLYAPSTTNLIRSPAPQFLFTSASRLIYGDLFPSVEAKIAVHIASGYAACQKNLKTLHGHYHWLVLATPRYKLLHL